MKKNENGNLSKSDVISFIALLFLGLGIFFGLNYLTLGDMLLSGVVAGVLTFLLIGLAMLTAWAKSQNITHINAEKWKGIEIVGLVFYVLLLIPAYLFSSKFMDVQMSKDDYVKALEKEQSSIEEMFKAYEVAANERANTYQGTLEAMLENPKESDALKNLLDDENITKSKVKAAVDNFKSSLLDGDYASIKAEKDAYMADLNAMAKNWNILKVTSVVKILDNNRNKYAEKLTEIFEDENNKSKTEIGESISFDAASYLSKENFVKEFGEINWASLWGILAVIVFGILGLFKYLFAFRNSSIIPYSSIESNGGIGF